ncbi:MAG TPA: amidase [Candidatus Udaeobacter sp.]|nr:amidase [Candidatus Udaeobacter sp.]
MTPQSHPQLIDATVAGLRAQLDSREHTVRRLAEMHLERVMELDEEGPNLRAVIQLNPEWEEQADRLDSALEEGRAHGPLHGIPIFVKDNIDTGDLMLTTAGSLAMARVPPAGKDAPLVARLREAGMLLLGKTNLSEWANFRSTRSSSGWSGRAGQCRNAHVVDRSPAGSSSGSAVAVAAGYAPVTVGTETDGSIIAPSAANGIVGIKPGVGLVSRQGIVPISRSQDTAGAHARHVRDAALLLSVLSDGGRDYTAGLSKDALKDRRIGVLREPYTGYSEHVDRVYDSVLPALRDLGAELIDPAVLETASKLRAEGRELETTLMQFEFKAGIEAYLSAREGRGPRTLADLIRFNEENAQAEMPYFGQEIFEAAQKRGDLEDSEYIKARTTIQRWARDEGIDATLARHRLDALIAPARPPSFVIDLINGDRNLGGCTQMAAVAGYPIITVPMGAVFDALPVGLAFFSGPGTEGLLLAMGYAFEQYVQARVTPRFLPTLDLP